MSVTIALAGNPNSGKTTMFNDLTGSSARVGNWPGVTVEKKEGRLRGDKDVVLQDLPGIYSLSPYTMEEVISRNYLLHEKPSVIINIVDASNIERNLYLTTQLAELGIPVVIALNMIDIVRKNGDVIDGQKLAEALGCEVVETSATKGIGSKEAAQKAIALAKKKSSTEPVHRFSARVEEALSEIQALVGDKSGDASPRWFAIKVFERDEELAKSVAFDAPVQKRLEEIISATESDLDDDAESIIANERYAFITNLIQNCVRTKAESRQSVSDKIDKVVTNRFLALPIFALIMYVVYYIAISTVGTMMTDWTNDSLFGEIVPGAVERLLTSIGTADWLSGLVLDGIVGGVGAVIGFLPQMLTLFLLLAILEESGYMARIAFIMDRFFRRFGLSGKSFIPMLISTGCGVPGIMASRAIESENDRRMTVMTTTFMPCGAKLPIIALIAGALFPGQTWVGPSAYFLGIAAIVISGIMLKKTKMFAGDPSPFVIELPVYRMPRIKSILRTMFERGWSFVKKAGTIVLLATVFVWFMSNFDTSLHMVEDTGDSILAGLGSLIAPLFSPLGWGDWKAAVASITGLIAKENVVGTFGVLYGYAEVAENGSEYWPQLTASFTQLSAYSFLVFNLLCAPCFAAIGALRREMMSAKWTWFAVGYQTGLAYALALIIYQIGLLVTGGGFTFWTAVAILLIGLIGYMLFRKPYSPKPTNSSVTTTPQGAR